MTRAPLALFAVFAFASCGAQKPPTLALNSPVSADSPTASLQADLSAIFTAPQFERSFWSVLVRPVESSDDLFTLNAEKLMMPGSTMKVVTAAAVVEKLGWDYRFETRVVTAAPVESGIVRGDVVIVGSGDPGISERGEQPGMLRSIARQLRDAGITSIEGGIVGDDDLLDDKGIGDGWTLDNLPYGYSAPVSALMYNEGSVDLVVRAGDAAGNPVGIDVRPNGSGLEIDNKLETVSDSGRGVLTLHRPAASTRITVMGQIPAKSAPFVRTASVANPTAFFATAFRLALIEEGVSVLGDAIDIDDFAVKPNVTDVRTLAVHRSPPLSDLVATMLKISQNQYAELLRKVIGGRRAVQDVLEGWGISNDSYIPADGSGLSRYNYIASDALVRLLQKMHTDPKHASHFPAALPVAGRDGLLSKRLAGTTAEGRVRAKTGTVDNVRSIAGYVTDADGDTLVFSMIANNFIVPTAVVDGAADRALIRLASYSKHARP